MATRAEENDRKTKALRKYYIEQQVKQFFARYTTTPTAAQIIADANKQKKRIDRFAYARIIAAANSLPKPAARPAAPPNGSIYFETPGSTAAPGGDVDPLLFVLAAVIAFVLLRR